MAKPDLSTAGRRLAHLRWLAREHEYGAPFPSTTLGTLAGLSHSAVGALERSDAEPQRRTLSALSGLLATGDTQEERAQSAAAIEAWLARGDGKAPERLALRATLTAAQTRANAARAS